MFGLFRRRPSAPQFGPGKLYMPEQLYRRMVRHCEEERPLEACGLVGGIGGQVMSAYAADNAERSPVVYAVENRQLVEALHAIERDRQQLVAIYHSHVRTPAIPSGTDVGQATWPEAYYLIISLAGRRPQVRAWRIVDGQVTEHQVVIRRGMTGLWRDLRRVARTRGVRPGESDIR